MANLEVTTWWLEMTERTQLRPARPPSVPVDVVRPEVASPEFGWFLFRAVGGPWYWTTRLAWSRDRWRDWLQQPQVEMWVAWVRGTPAGYAELVEHPAGDVEIRCFGLIPQFIGQGIGGHLLTVATEQAWDREHTQSGQKTTRVWLHTCSLDGPHARANYEARGFRVTRTVSEVKEQPDTPPSIWADQPVGT